MSLGALVLLASVLVIVTAGFDRELRVRAAREIRDEGDVVFVKAGGSAFGGGGGGVSGGGEEGIGGARITFCFLVFEVSECSVSESVPAAVWNTDRLLLLVRCDLDMRRLPLP